MGPRIETSESGYNFVLGQLTCGGGSDRWYRQVSDQGTGDQMGGYPQGVEDLRCCTLCVCIDFELCVQIIRF